MSVKRAIRGTCSISQLHIAVPHNLEGEAGRRQCKTTKAGATCALRRQAHVPDQWAAAPACAVLRRAKVRVCGEEEAARYDGAGEREGSWWPRMRKRARRGRRGLLRTGSCSSRQSSNRTSTSVPVARYWNEREGRRLGPLGLSLRSFVSATSSRRRRERSESYRALLHALYGFMEVLLHWDESTFFGVTNFVNLWKPFS